MNPPPPYGLLAGFASPEKFAAAADRTRRAGYTRCETYLPFALPAGVEFSAAASSPVPKAMLVGGLLSGLTAFFLQFYATHDYPLNVGGRPLNSWPAFVPITFELTVLGAAVCGIVTFLWIAGLPQLDHPVFSDPHFVRASSDRFFLCIRGDDPLFESAATERFLASLDAESVAKVPS
jgi:hypothetical protein